MLWRTLAAAADRRHDILEAARLIAAYVANTTVSVEFLNASARKLVQPGEMSVTLQTESVRG